MNLEIVTIFFSINIVSFILSNYSYNKNLDENLKYKEKDYFNLSFISNLILNIILIISFFISNRLLINLSIILISIIVFIQIIFSILKIKYFSKEFKAILESKDYNISRSKVKGQLEIEALKNIFYLLAPLPLFLEYLINLILKKIFK
jgi:hypothetical protein